MRRRESAGVQEIDENTALVDEGAGRAFQSPLVQQLGAETSHLLTVHEHNPREVETRPKGQLVRFKGSCLCPLARMRPHRGDGRISLGELY